jgi:Protein of unknown function (DUF4242)
VTVTTYFVECYWPGVDEPRLCEVIDRLAAKTRADVDWVGSILIPEDEIVLCLATGPSAQAIRATAHIAGLPAERVVTCVRVSPERKEQR